MFATPLLWGVALVMSARADVPGLHDPLVYAPEVFPSDEVGAGEMRLDDGSGRALVLEHTSVVAEIHVGLARVTQTQWFHNPYEEPISAEYLFPLPADSAVDAMELRCGDRVIEGVVMERQAARDAYNEARKDGRKAALLEQQRENLFRQHVANLCPDEEVQVTLQYVQQVAYRDGEYRLDVPFAVGPRYSPPWVEDAAALETPYARDGGAVDVTVLVEEGVPVGGLWSETHDVVIVEEGTWGAEVQLLEGEELPNRDFSLQWTLAGNQPQAMVVAHRADADEPGYIAVSIEPQVLDDYFVARPRELLFVIDQSGSMQGEPYDVARQTVLHAIDTMDDDDTFNVIGFSSQSRALFPTPQASSAQNRARAEAWLDRFDGGSTEMQRGIIQSLTMPGDPERMRLVLMLTDGFIGGETHMFATVRKHLGSARLFSLGVGSSPNRFLLEGLAEMGRGDVIYHAWGSSVQGAVTRFYDRIAHPAMSEIEIDWGGLEIEQQYPRTIPDVWAGSPVRVVARYTPGQETAGGVLQTTLRVSGRVGRDIVDIDVPIEVPVDAAPSHEAVASLWARRRIRDVEWYPGERNPAQVRADVIDVALSHHLVSTYTSLVAIDEQPGTCGPASQSFIVPQLAPAGVNMEAAGAGMQYGSGGMGSRGIGYGGGGYSGRSVGALYGKGRGSVGTVQGAPIILGSIDRSSIGAVIKRNVGKFKTCYERELKTDPTLSGRVEVKFSIAPDGAVAVATIKNSTLGSPVVEQCMVKHFKRLTFPAPVGGGHVVVTYPFVFQAPEPEDAATRRARERPNRWGGADRQK
jgi:Ca-activated chloride channel homolog